ncbi:MAG TPA: LPS assembly lipoprotein LptE [Burkholderiales bacterium]|nr:LPS assembly lipoprotein LptE [Burkholderiales bacterium]
MTVMMRNLLLAFATVVLFTACGFQLRGSANLPYDTLFVAAPGDSGFAAEFKRAVRTGSKARIADSAKEAQATLHLLAEAREKVILSLSGGGRVREYQLRYRVAYRLVDKDNKELRPPTQIALERDLYYNDNDTLSKESEEALLYRDMQTDAASQLLRQLQTARIGQ